MLPKRQGRCVRLPPAPSPGRPGLSDPHVPGSPPARKWPQSPRGAGARGAGRAGPGTRRPTPSQPSGPPVPRREDAPRVGAGAPEPDLGLSPARPSPQGRHARRAVTASWEGGHACRPRGTGEGGRGSRHTAGSQRGAALSSPFPHSADPQQLARWGPAVLAPRAAGRPKPVPFGVTGCPLPTCPRPAGPRSRELQSQEFGCPPRPGC